MFSRRVISLLVVLSFVSQALVVVEIDNSSNFVEDSSPLEELPEYGASRSGHHEIENATLLKDVNPELREWWSKGSNPHNHFAHTDGNLYWTANNGPSSNYELWTSDGTEDGTYMVKDINPGSDDGGSPSFYASMGDILFFAADNGTTGHELWRTDGTEEGTYMVKDICPQNMDDGSGCDGIASGTLGQSSGAWPFSVNDEFILFQAKNDTYNEELWRSDGTENGTYMVKDINTFEDDGSKPSHFRLLGDGKVIFSACGYSSACHDKELWITDGTEEGTQLVKDINPGSDGGDPQWFTMLDDVYYFMAEDENYKRELWRTDGTTNGTYRLTAFGDGSSYGLLSPALPFRDFLVFEGRQAWPDERELYKYDPSTNETTLLTDFEWDSDAYDPRLRFVVNDKIVFQMNCEGLCNELWTTDGTEVSSSFFFNNTLDNDRYIFSPIQMPPTRGQSHFNTYYPVHENVGVFDVGNGEHEGMWATDGTTNGTYRITYNLTSINDGHIAGGNLFFSAQDTVHGEEMRVIRNFTTTAYHTLYKDKVMDPITFDYDGEDADWAIYPDLPASLSFNLEDGTITGTPDELFSLISFTVYANGSVNETYKIKLKSVQYPDTDGDGVCDGASGVSGICTAGPDAFPFDAAASVDTDGDGMPDTLNGESTSEPPLVEDLDDDNDGLLDLDEIANGTEPLNPDTDGDGYCDGSGTVESCIAGDVFPLNENEWFDTDGDGTGNNADTDDDNDGLDDTTEASSDPVTNSTNPDTDGDGVCDGSVNVTINDAQICIGGPDELPTDPDETIDTDGDGIGNNGDTDDDNDGLSDDEENEIGTDPLDPDTDGDFYCDGPIVVTGCAGSDDAFPLDDSEWLDTDGDGIGNNVDPDDDGDSYTDIFENDNGYDPLDGCDPNLNSSTCDQDKDGLNNGEEITLGTNVTNPDTDGDGFCDGDLGVEGICVAGPDDFPLDPAAYLDTDGDEMPDTINGTSTSEPVLIEDLDDDNDGLLDLDEIANGTESLNPDSDGDGYCDGSVTVGSCIAGDVFPLDENEWFDTDGDEIGNNADFDDDNDGYNDTIEISEGSDPLNITSTPLDTDDDKIPDSIDADDDNDGYNDTVDAFPTNVTEWLDTDDDGTGNNADFDDDGDGYNDTMELSEGSDPLDSESIPLDTDGDKIPDSTDTDDDNDGYNDTVDAFPTTSDEWLDTDDDGIGNNADTDDDGDTLSDAEEAEKGTNPLTVDTDADGIPDNFDPSPTDPNGDFDGDGKLDSEEYNPDADGNPADADGNGENDMLQALASESNTSSSDRSWKEMCCWALLLLLLLLFPLGKKRYDNSLIYQPNDINYVIGDNESKIRAVPSLHEYTKKYLSLVNKDGLKNITYGISGDLNELEIDSKTGVISGHPEKTGKYIYEITMKHSKGKYKGELIVNVTSKDEKVEKPEEPEASTPALSSNPEPENTSSKPKFKGGSGTKMDPFVITPAKGLAAGDEIVSKQVITISGLKSGGIVNMSDLEIGQNGKRFAIVSEPDEVGRQSALVADDDGKIKFRIHFKDDEPSYDGANYEGLLKLGVSSVYFTWTTEVLEDTSEADAEKEVEIKAEEEAKDREIELAAKEEELKVKETEIDSKQAELDRIAAKAETIDFGVIGTASASEKDDLKIIKGIGPFIEKKLNALGIYQFAQIAKMTSKLEDEVNIAIEFFPGRVKRDEWVKQANQLAK